MVQKKKNKYILKKLINKFHKKGKKSSMRRYFLDIFYRIRLIGLHNPLSILYNGLYKIQPYVEIKKLKHFGKLKLIPLLLNKKRKMFLVLNWFFKSIFKIRNQKILNKFVIEILNLTIGLGDSAVYKKEDIKKAVINRTFIHFRWRFNKKNY